MCFGGGSRTSRGRYSPADICSAAQSRLAVLSRAFPPEGSLHPFGRGDVARRLNPSPAHYRPATLPPSSCTRSPIGAPCGLLSLAGGLRAYHVPQT
jgi:hypothetical protein